MILAKLTLIFLITFNSFIAFVPSCHATTNLALNKPYSLSSKPNYALSAPPSDTTSLTDGKYSTGFFWTQKTTVGWQNVKTVEIMIDLEKISTIGSISFSTARGIGSDVHYPSNISAFVGSEKNKLLYVGDIAKEADSLTTVYQAKQLIMNNINVKGRYILLEVELRGYYLFCDEIEVLEGANDTGRGGNLTIDEARDYAQQIVRIDIEKKILNNILETNLNTDPSHLEASGVEKKVAALSTLKEVASVETDILSLRQKTLSKQFPAKQILIEALTPWGHITALPQVSGVTPTNLPLVMPRGGYDHAALLLTNPTAAPLQVSLSLARSEAAAPELSLYEAKFIKTAAFETVPDPLVPVKGGLTLLPGESKVLFLSAQAKQSGTWNSVMTISFGNFSAAVTINSKVVASALPQHQTLNSVNWGYLNFPMIKDRADIAVKDMAAHHTNVLVVPPNYLSLKSFGKQADFTALKHYLVQSGKNDKVLFFMGNTLKTVYSNEANVKFLDDQWKSGFKLWYDGLLKTTIEAGYSPEQIYLYPYDEMHGDEIDQFIAFASWAKKTIHNVNFFATIDTKEALKALPYLDIAQLILNNDLLSAANQYSTVKWIYGTQKPAKSLSPYAYYRLMSWKAFLSGYKGIGFWDYADASGSAWDDFDGKNPDYAVIYEGENNTIISSRRWEAWRMGIEDYELLTMYAHKKGEAAAKALAKDVMDNSEDTSRADKVRRKILNEI